jgi:hypothetical protein
MISIYSKVQQDLLLCRTQNLLDVTDKRLDMSPEDEFLQVSILNLMSRKIDPHIHLTKDSMSIKVQECWILMRGNITVSLYVMVIYLLLFMAVIRLHPAMMLS